MAILTMEQLERDLDFLKDKLNEKDREIESLQDQVDVLHERLRALERKG